MLRALTVMRKQMGEMQMKLDLLIWCIEESIGEDMGLGLGGMCKENPLGGLSGKAVMSGLNLKANLGSGPSGPQPT